MLGKKGTTAIMMQTKFQYQMHRMFYTEIYTWKFLPSFIPINWTTNITEKLVTFKFDHVDQSTLISQLNVLNTLWTCCEGTQIIDVCFMSVDKTLWYGHVVLVKTRKGYHGYSMHAFHHSVPDRYHTFIFKCR